MLRVVCARLLLLLLLLVRERLRIIRCGLVLLLHAMHAAKRRLSRGLGTDIIRTLRLLYRPAALLVLLAVLRLSRVCGLLPLILRLAWVSTPVRARVVVLAVLIVIALPWLILPARRIRHGERVLLYNAHSARSMWACSKAARQSCQQAER